MKILKSDGCPSISQSSEIAYNIGCNDKKEIHFALTGNTGGGKFNKGWVSWKKIDTLLSSEKHFSSGLLHPLFKGKSTNSPSFLFAAILNEGLVGTTADDPRKYERLDPSDFNKNMKKLANRKKREASK